ncbi:regulatory protein RecX [Acetonema longum]|uniref:Regulatory protein RecX n=1 Tax=Acetonema longum DSM 6540 TaxID=1009370 RepID=F7NPE2_9FIRM|nr:regulatory protein RecX [Acetonema longum]EGO62104.1 recombination regulator RecX [Acetonema longum DSM 6540]
MNEAEVLALAMRLLGRRDLSEYELRQKLRLKALPSQVDRTVSYLLERHYLSDELLCRRLIEKHCIQGDLGSLGIRNKLRKRGISDPIIREQMSQIDFSEEDIWAKDLLTKRRLLDDLPKAARFLYSRGFSRPVINRVISPLMTE